MNQTLENLNCSWTEESERLFVTPSNELKNFLFYVQETGKFSTFQPYFTEREGLHSFLILLTLSGEGALEYQNRRYCLKKGDVFFIDCKPRHKYFAQSKENWDFLWVHFYGADARGFFNYFSAQNEGVATKVRSEECVNIMTRLNEINRRPSPQSDILSFRLLSELLSELLLSGTPAAFSPNTVPEHMLKLRGEIDRRFCQTISLERLAKSLGRNKYALCRDFKKYFGIGFKEYVTTKRISYAKELLRFSDRSVSEISEMLGYENTEYVIALFKRYEHTTPLAFRKKWQNLRA